MVVSLDALSNPPPIPSFRLVSSSAGFHVGSYLLFRLLVLVLAGSRCGARLFPSFPKYRPETQQQQPRRLYFGALDMPDGFPFSRVIFSFGHCGLEIGTTQKAMRSNTSFHRRGIGAGSQPQPLTKRKMVLRGARR